MTTQALVTGCAGFIGSHLTEALLAAGVAVRGVDAFTDYYDPARKRANLQAAREDPRFELVEADLARAGLGPLLDGVHTVYHLAGQPGVPDSWSGRFDAYVERNVIACQRLLEALRESPVQRVVYASSSSVYGNGPRYPVDETDLPRPHSPYGVTKLAGEHLCGLYAENWALPTVILRYFSVYGPRQRPDMGFERFFDAALAGRPLAIYGTGKQARDFTYVGDVVAATMAAGRSDLEPGTVCNIAGGASVSVEALVPVLAELLGRDVSVEHLAPRPGEVERTGGSVERARRLLGWEPETTLREGLAAQLAEIRSRRS